MKVRQLIAKLQKADPDLEVILSSDMEGNSFDFVNEVVGIKNITYYHREKDELGGNLPIELYDESEEEIPEGVRRCIVLFP